MSDETLRPRVCVGLVVYNGQAFLEETMRSLLAQTYSDFELVVSDNASTDGTVDIIRRLAQDDPRIRLHSFSTNQGPAANYNKVVELAGPAEYFMWSAADDLRDPTFLERCVDVLDQEPQTVLAYTRTKVIEQGRPPVWHDYEPDIDSETPHERLHTLLSIDHRRHGAFEIFGVMRLAVLKDVLPQGAYSRSDSVILARMALRGRFIRVPEYLFFNRNHPQRSVRSVPSRTYGGAGIVVGRLGSGPVPPDDWWDATKRDRVVWPEWKLVREYVAAVAQAPLSRRERRACGRVLAEYTVKHVPKLFRDVLINTEFDLRKAIARAM
jgi:glycosyltransferase involved in cell wall biosynthesis